WPQRVLSVILRIGFVALLALGLSRLARTATTEKVCTVYMVDVSDSVTDESLVDAQAALADAIKAKPKDALVKVITFARRPRVVDPPDGKPDEPPTIARHSDGAGSNLQAALQLAYGLYPPGYLKRAVVFSDGVQTDGDFLAEANRAHEFGVKLFSVP